MNCYDRCFCEPSALNAGKVSMLTIGPFFHIAASQQVSMTESALSSKASPYVLLAEVGLPDDPLASEEMLAMES
ncbi:hypothetical protein BLNAU_22904 [Blattamonas nauphoetae]|uniref:Uncharacterized protein n=1 Tax=Blattamonas nauphoetae TaxID=2049346 RepID=A0ABQ9WTX9_9EUKA|nr:hypothetical protein BLNAU_22904 [Blattamonas nauphoetae]